MKKIFLYLFLLIFLSASAWGAEINCTTLVADGSSSRTDNTSALNTCLSNAAAQPEKICNIPSSGGDWYYWATRVTVPEGVEVKGASGAEVEGPFKLSNDDSKIVNLTFHSGISTRPIEIGTYQSSTPVDGVHVRDCTITVVGGSSVITAWNMNNSIIDNNNIDNNDPSSPYAQNIEVQAGNNNAIVNNVIDGGKTGIIMKYGWSNSGNSPGYFYNVIMNNSITAPDEEFISFDMGVNDSTNTSMREADTVASVSSNQVTLSDSGWGGGDDPDYVGAYLVVVVDNDGQEEISGEFRKITGQSDATFTLESAITGLEAGDWISIGAIAAYNYIAFNTCDNGPAGKGYGRSAPLLYGMSFLNRIEENDTTGISVRSLDEHFAGTVTGNGGRGPASYNLVRGNAVTRYGWTSCTANVGFCDILAIYRDLEKTDQYADYKSWGNVVVSNTIGDDLYFTLQDYYQSSNTYDSLELSNSTDAGSTALDTSSYTCEEYGLSCVPADSTIALVSDLDSTCPGNTICAGYGEAASGPDPAINSINLH